MNKTLKITVTIFVLFFLIYVSLHHQNKKNKISSHIIQVENTPLSSTLFYTGIIQPVKLATITSNTDGMIESTLFNYGDKIKADQVLFIISSEKFHADYKTILMQYIKSKSDYVTNKNRLIESRFLHNSQLISDDEYKSKQVEYYNAQLEMVQSRDSLSSMLKRLDLRGVNIDALKIQDVEKISHLIESDDGSQRLKIVSKVSGVILQPTKNESGEGELKKVMPGDQAKLNEVLAIITDMSRLLIHIEVSEFNINQIKVGQKVQVTGAAFPSMVLDGTITAVNQQGESGQNGTQSFPVEVTVGHLTHAQQAIIHIGMSVQVAINIIEGEKITIPIGAVVQKNQDSYVQVKDSHSGKVHPVKVTLGKTVMNSVIVESNLMAGDKIVLTN